MSCPNIYDTCPFQPCRGANFFVSPTAQVESDVCTYLLQPPTSPQLTTPSNGDLTELIHLRHLPRYPIKLESKSKTLAISTKKLLNPFSKKTCIPACLKRITKLEPDELKHKPSRYLDAYNIYLIPRLR